MFLILMAGAVGVFGQEYELDTIYRAENVDTLPVSRFDRRSLDILVRNYAFIPNKAQKKGIEGTVIVSFVVYKNGGSASDIKVIQSPDTLGILDSAAISIVKGFYLYPAIKDGKPVNVRIEMPIEYHLRKDVYEENYEEYQSYSVQHRKYYYTPSNASFAGRFYVSVHYGAISLLIVKIFTMVLWIFPVVNFSGATEGLDFRQVWDGVRCVIVLTRMRCSV